MCLFFFLPLHGSVHPHITTWTARLLRPFEARAARANEHASSNHAAVSRRYESDASRVAGSRVAPIRGAFRRPPRIASRPWEDTAVSSSISAGSGLPPIITEPNGSLPKIGAASRQRTLPVSWGRRRHRHSLYPSDLRAAHVMALVRWVQNL